MNDTQLKILNTSIFTKMSKSNYLDIFHVKWAPKTFGTNT